MPRARLTVFSRFLLFMLIALPLIFIAASYYNGEDPVANVKAFFGAEGEQTADVRRSDPDPGDTEEVATFENVQNLRAENERLRAELEACRNKD